MTAARAVLCLLSLVLPVALWPGSTAYESAKLLLWAWAAAAWLVIAALAAARGRVGPAPVRGLVVAGLAMIAVQAPALALADSPHLAGRALLWSAVWWLTATVVAATARETRHRQRLLACATAGAVTTCGVALLQLAGVAPAPANPYVPVGIGTLGNENSVSELAAAWLLPSLLLPLSMRRRAWRAVGLLPALVMAAMLAASDAAAARVGAAAAVAFALAGEAMLRSRRPERTPLLLGALVSAGALAAGVLVSQVQRGGPLASNQDLLSARVLAANHGAERRADWLVASELWRRAPLTGCGAGNYGVNWLRTRADLAVASDFPAPAGGAPVATRAHNEYLQWTAETGWAGVVWLAAVVVAGFLAWSRAWRAAANRAERRSLLFTAAGVIAVAVMALAAFPAHLPASGLSLALLVGLSRPAAAMAPPGRRFPRWCAAPLLVAGALLAVAGARVFHGDLLLERGSRAFTAGAFASCIQDLEAGVARVPWPGPARLELGLALAATGRLPEATTMLEASLRDRPSFEAPLALAEIDLDGQQPKRAADWLDLVERCAPPAAVRKQVAYLRAYAHLRAGDPAAAREAFADLVARDRLDHRAWLALGYADDLLGDPAAATAAYRQAVAAIEAALATERPDSRVARGEIARLQAQLDVARRALASVNAPAQMARPTTPAPTAAAPAP